MAGPVEAPVKQIAYAGVYVVFGPMLIQKVANARILIQFRVSKLNGHLESHTLSVSLAMQLQ